MTNLKTKESTLEALRKAMKTPPTAEEIHRQRVSFILGSLDTNNHMTRARVEEIILEQQEGRKVEK
jgi:hypothetical protein